MKKCKHKKLLLGTVWVNSITPDQEPYKAGQIQRHAEIADINQNLIVHYCERCNRIVEVSLE